MPVVREVERCLRAIRSHNGFINAFTAVRPTETLLKEAALSNERIVSNCPLSNIDGKIIAVKDNICTDDVPTTCSSDILRDYHSPFAATVVAKLNKAGAIVVGKTNMDEFGMGSHSIHSAFGPVKRPRRKGEAENEGRSAGGSSGGSAAAVAANLCDGALGTDTGGSVRLPAAFCGIYGLKPSYGMISRWGVVAYSNSLDTVGILARDRRSVENMFNATSGYDKRDPTSLSDVTRSRITEAIHKSRPQSMQPLRIGVPLEYNVKELAPSVLTAWKETIQHLAKLGHTIAPISLPNTKHALSTYYILAAAEASSNLAKYDGLRYGKRHEKDWVDKDWPLFASTRGTGFGDEVRRRILLGTYSLSASAMDNYFMQAQRVRRLIQSDFNNAFSLPHPLYPPCTSHSSHSQSEPPSPLTPPTPKTPSAHNTADVLITPCSLSPAPLLRDVFAQKSPLDAYVNDVLTVPASLAGIPAMSVPVRVNPAGEGEEEMLGMQLLAQFGDEGVLFEVARGLEEG